MGSWSLTGNAVAVAPDAFLGTTDNNALVIQTGNPSAERMRIDPGGNVGIGTNAPISKLHVNGAVTLSPQSNVVLPDRAFGSVVGAILRQEVHSIGAGIV